MTERTVKIGIVGAGIWGRNHALALTTHAACRGEVISPAATTVRIR